MCVCSCVRVRCAEACVCVCVYVCVHHQRPHCEIKYICLFVVCFQIIFKFVVDITTKKPREARFFFFGQCHGQYSSAHRI